MAQQALGEWELLQGSDDEWEDVGPGQESVELPTSQPAGPGAAEPAAAAVELPRVTPALQQVPAVQKLAPEVVSPQFTLETLSGPTGRHHSHKCAQLSITVLIDHLTQLNRASVGKEGRPRPLFGEQVFGAARVVSGAQTRCC